MRTFRIFAIAGMLLALFPLPALADMKTFNDAVKVGDYKAAAAAARETWPQLDSSNPDMAVIAREFAWAAMRGGDAENAEIYAGFLVEHGTGLQPPDAMPLTSAVLKAWAGFTISDTKQTRKALIEALTGRLQGASVDIISLAAAESFYTRGIQTQNWEDARDAARVGAQLATRGQGATVLPKYRAEIVSLAAEIMTKPQRQAYDQLVELDKRLFDEAGANAASSKALWALHDLALGWRRRWGRNFPVPKTTRRISTAATTLAIPLQPAVCRSASSKPYETLQDCWMALRREWLVVLSSTLPSTKTGGLSVQG